MTLKAAKTALQKTARTLLPISLRHFIAQGARDVLDEHAQTTYSQEGEDILLRLLFEHRKEGFYVDVGAHDPVRFSNTYSFYRAGWRGINIDPLPGSMKKFDKLRPRDINLELPIADRPDLCTYHIFDEPALNTLSPALAEQRLREGNFKLLGKKQIATRRLDDVLDQYLPQGSGVDFLSVDAEGMDLAVLKSNHWEKYPPKVVLAEIAGVTIDDIVNSETHHYLGIKGYHFFARTFHTAIFLSRPFRERRFNPAHRE